MRRIVNKPFIQLYNRHQLMKWLILFFLVFEILAVKGQTVYSWINQPYIPANITENEHDSFQVDLKQIESVKIDYEFHNDDRSISHTLKQIAFDINGNLSKIEVVKADGSGYLHRLYYTDTIFKFETITYFMEESGLIDTVREDTNWTKKTIQSADSLVNDKNQRSTIAYYGRQSVYTKYDEWGRKVLDSIPATPFVELHEIDYKYTKNKIIQTTYFPRNDMKITTKYWMDDQHNWVKAIMKYNSRKKKTIILRTFEYDQD